MLVSELLEGSWSIFYHRHCLTGTDFQKLCSLTMILCTEPPLIGEVLRFPNLVGVVKLLTLWLKFDVPEGLGDGVTLLALPPRKLSLYLTM